MEFFYPEGKTFKWKCFLFGCKQSYLGFCDRGCGRFTNTTGYGLYVHYIPDMHGRTDEH